MTTGKPERVGIRQLRQNLSVYVKRVREDGRAYEVTERGEPVARLTPMEERPGSITQRMIADGRITPATRSLADLPPPVKLLGRSLSDNPPGDARRGSTVNVGYLDSSAIVKLTADEAESLAIAGELEAFISYDVRLADAARAAGLAVVAPA